MELSDVPLTGEFSPMMSYIAAKESIGLLSGDYYHFSDAPSVAQTPLVLEARQLFALERPSQEARLDAALLSMEDFFTRHLARSSDPVATWRGCSRDIGREYYTAALTWHRLSLIDPRLPCPGSHHMLNLRRFSLGYAVNLFGEGCGRNAPPRA